MENENTIICENCYEENDNTRRVCKNCGNNLYKNILEKKETEIEKTSKSNKIGKTESYYEEDQNNSYTKNKIAQIIKGISIITALFGIIAGFIQFNLSILVGLIYIIVSIVVAAFVYSLGEIIQLLEDIKNK